MIEVDQSTLQLLMPRVSGRKAECQRRIVAEAGTVLAPTLARYRITTSLRIAHFLAQIAHESDGFSTCEEYASGAAYEGRQKLGNTKPGDGVRFKGRGLIQLTGRANYQLYGARIGLDLLASPELAEEPRTALILACEYWSGTEGGLNRFADADDILSITRAINGGLNGLADRRAYLAKAKQAVARAVAGTMPRADGAGGPPVLHRGMVSDEIEALQRLLAAAGFPVPIDGEFGPATEALLKVFQRAKGLVPDGIVGLRTWAALGRAPRRGVAPVTPIR